MALFTLRKMSYLGWPFNPFSRRRSEPSPPLHKWWRLWQHPDTLCPAGEPYPYRIYRENMQRREESTYKACMNKYGYGFQFFFLNKTAYIKVMVCWFEYRIKPHFNSTQISMTFKKLFDKWQMKNMHLLWSGECVLTLSHPRAWGF